MTEVINALMQMQAEKGITDDALALAIGIRRPSWGRIKRTKRFGKYFLRHARLAYPSIFLPKNVNE